MTVTLKYDDLYRYIRENYGKLQHFEIHDILKLYFGINPEWNEVIIDYDRLNGIMDFCKNRCSS